MNTGGSAFPSEQNETLSGTWNQTYESGMTLRDWFAGHSIMAAQDLLLSALKPGERIDEKVIAKAAYAYADAMIAERDKEMT